MSCGLEFFPFAIAPDPDGGAERDSGTVPGQSVGPAGVSDPSSTKSRRTGQDNTLRGCPVRPAGGSFTDSGVTVGINPHENLATEIARANQACFLRVGELTIKCFALRISLCEPPRGVRSVKLLPNVLKRRGPDHISAFANANILLRMLN